MAEVDPDWIFESESQEATEELARRLAAQIQGGEIFLLRGELAAGKTFFVSALAEALGSAEPAVSPTFVIQRSYGLSRGLTLHHLDFYRFEGAADAETIGAEELHDPHSIVAVEWPERYPEAFPEWTLDLRIEVTGENARRIEGRWGLLPFNRNFLARGAA
jgi:tRNA threonylcarbamoyladenosine biosynthesis protein TsaE